ncbi:hypothetical protein OF83DRAFT_1149113 [Amylostereum chailletii]|nr:hypothetical protein OF83DRAFT_1149113 [Amylostereum chailletii]
MSPSRPTQRARGRRSASWRTGVRTLYILCLALSQVIACHRTDETWNTGFVRYTCIHRLSGAPHPRTPASTSTFNVQRSTL